VRYLVPVWEPGSDLYFQVELLKVKMNTCNRS
jgi:hypothetical protein